MSYPWRFACTCCGSTALVPRREEGAFYCKACNTRQAEVYDKRQGHNVGHAEYRQIQVGHD